MARSVMRPYLGGMSALSIFKPIIVVILAMAFALPIGGSMIAESAESLKSLVGKKRPLLLFSKSRSDARLDKQIDLLRERRPELRERDMVVLVTAGNQATMAAIGYVSLPAGAERDLRDRYKPEAKGLTIILVGKDGAEKGRWTQPLDPGELFDLIDTMPMRQQEMRDASDS